MNRSICMLNIAIILYLANPVSGQESPHLASSVSLFSGLVSGSTVAAYTLMANPNRPFSDIFSKHLGHNKPYQEVLSVNRPRKPASYFTSKVWERTESEFYRTYGRNSQTEIYLDWQKYLYEKHYRIEHGARALNSKISGSVGESFMDEFFIRSGWEKLKPRNSSQGIDGLYVKRGSNGVISKMDIVESKTGASKINDTKNGKQTSQLWSKINLGKLLADTQKEISKAKINGDIETVIKLQKLASDYKRCIRLADKGAYRAELFSQKNHFDGDKSYVEINLQKVKPVGQKDIFIEKSYRTIKVPFLGNEQDHLSRLGASSWDKLTEEFVNQGMSEAKAQKAIQLLQERVTQGKITTNEQYNKYRVRLLRSEPTLRERAIERAGQIPEKTTLAGIRAHSLGYARAGVYGAMLGGVLSAITQYSATNQVDWRMAGYSSGIGGGIAITAKISQRFAESGINKLATSGIGNKIFGKVITGSLVSKAGFIASSGVGAAITVGVAAYGYWSGALDARQALVTVGVGAATIGVSMAATSITCVILSSSAAGAALGSGVPVIGNAVGLVVGTGIGVTHAIYMKNIEENRFLAQRLEYAYKEADLLNRKNEKEREDLIRKSEQLKREGWQELKI